ncbi:MAG TPA: multicopper oxidase domain-containing protein [Gaiellaceae bacterium]
MHSRHGEAMPGGGHAQAAHHVASARLENRQPITLATFTATRFGQPLRLPEGLASLPPYDPDNVNGRRRIVFSEEMGQGPVRFLINGKSFEPERIDFHSQQGSIEIWEVINDADMDHPFHLHIYPFIVLSRNGRPEPVRMWRDTVNLATGDRVELLVPFEHFSGTTIYHCHIVEHEDRGMMAQFAVVPTTRTDKPRASDCLLLGGNAQSESLSRFGGNATRITASARA